MDSEKTTIHNVHGRPPADCAWIQNGNKQWYLRALPLHIAALAGVIYDANALLAHMLNSWEAEGKKKFPENEGGDT